VSARYQVLPSTAPVPAPDDILEAVAREGARKMLARALEIEREEFLGRVHYQRGAVRRLIWRRPEGFGRVLNEVLGRLPLPLASGGPRWDRFCTGLQLEF